jgi:hypothetical protein
MSNLKFNPTSDIPSLDGRVFLITGGMWRSAADLVTR